MHLDLSSLKKQSTPAGDHATTDDILGQIYIFEGLSADFRASIASRCDRESFASGEDIIREGDESNGKAYIILSGSVDVTIAGTSVATLSSGDIFGEYALICAENRTATVCALESTECLILDEDTIISVSNENNQINDIMIARINANAWEDQENIA